MSSYDYPDPGTDPAYCNGLAAKGKDSLDDCGRVDRYCLWCGFMLWASSNSDYCSLECVIRAELDSIDSE